MTSAINTSTMRLRKYLDETSLKTSLTSTSANSYIEEKYLEISTKCYLLNKQGGRLKLSSKAEKWDGGVGGEVYLSRNLRKVKEKKFYKTKAQT